MGHQRLLSFLCHTPQTSLWNNNLETLNYWSLRKQLILFPENLRDSREAKLTVFRRTSLFKSDLLYSWKFWSWKFIKPRCNGGRWSTFAGNSALLPSDVVDFAMLPAKRFCRETVSLLDVTWTRSIQWERALLGKFSSYIIIPVALPASETPGRMDTSLRCSDFWDCLGGQALIMIGRWCPG